MKILRSKETLDFWTGQRKRLANLYLTSNTLMSTVGWAVGRFFNVIAAAETFCIPTPPDPLVDACVDGFGSDMWCSVLSLFSSKRFSKMFSNQRSSSLGSPSWKTVCTVFGIFYINPTHLGVINRLKWFFWKIRFRRDLLRAKWGWALSGTELSQAEHCPGQREVRLSTVREAAKSCWALFWKQLSHTEHCSGQSWVRLSTVRDRAESRWALFGTELSQAGPKLRQSEHCRGQREVRLSTFRDRAESDWALPGTNVSQAEHCPGQR